MEFYSQSKKADLVIFNFSLCLHISAFDKWLKKFPVASCGNTKLFTFGRFKTILKHAFAFSTALAGTVYNAVQVHMYVD
jgi:hypothetical protein